jgi:hypothetical protein
MGKNSRDRFLDAFLSEAIGGQRPPDLSDRILKNLGQQPSRERRGGGALIFLVLAATVFVTVVAFAFVQFNRSRRSDDQLAKSQTKDGSVERRRETTDGLETSPRQDGVAETKKARTPTDGAPRSDGKTSVAKSSPGSEASPDGRSELVDPRESPSKPVLVASSDEAILKALGESLRRRWQEEKVTPAGLATDAEWCRRVFLDLIGRIPTYDEIATYTADKSADKKRRLVDNLMSSDIYLEEFARNWTNVWTNLLIGRDASNRDGAVHREGFQQFVRRSFLTNKPYDQFVAELLTASGSNRPGDEDFNGAVSFMTENMEAKAISATAKTAKVFLGLQVQCTQCHNHPFNDWKQNQFWQLNAFFRQAQPQREGRGRDAFMRLKDVSFKGEGADDASEGEIYYEERSGLMKVAYPVFIDGTKISTSGAIGEVNRRKELAKLIVKSEYFSRALVNRVWSHFLGYGFTRSVDDMGPHNPPSHPDVLDLLAQQFVSHGHDLRKLFRWVALSEPYALSSAAPPGTGGANNVDDPDAGSTPLFSRFYIRQMRPEELYESLLVATRAAQQVAGDFSEQELRKNRWLQQFTIAYQTDEKDEATTFNGNVTQTLMMWNGELVGEATSGGKGTFLQQVAASNQKPQTKINQLFMAALARRPSKAELDMANKLWQSRGGDTLAALQDIWWVLLNTNEFILNH